MPKGMHEGHRKRLKEEFMISGFNSETPPHKIVELLLFYSIPRKNTNEIAHLLIDEFGSLTNLIDARSEDITRVAGAGENTATLLQLIRFISNYYINEKKKNVKSLNDIDDLCSYIFDKYVGITKEMVTLVSLDNSGRILGFDAISEGDISSVGISSRQVIETVIKRNASSVVLSHNHPKGLALPSVQDIESTKTIREVLKNINVPLVDHIIISDDDYTSLRLSGKYEYIFKDKKSEDVAEEKELS